MSRAAVPMALLPLRPTPRAMPLALPQQARARARAQARSWDPSLHGIQRKQLDAGSSSNRAYVRTNRVTWCTPHAPCSLKTSLILAVILFRASELSCPSPCSGLVLGSANVIAMPWGSGSVAAATPASVFATAAVSATPAGSSGCALVADI